MPPSKRTSSVLNPGDVTDHDDLTQEADTVTDPDDALAAADEADAEAAEADAKAAAARARARAIRLRREAAAAVEAAAAADTGPDVESRATEPSEPVVATRAVEEKADEETADEEAAEQYPDEPSESSERTRRPGLVRLVLKSIAVALVVLTSLVLLGLSGWMYTQHRNAEAQRQQTAEFTAAARQGAITLMSLDFNHAKENVQAIIDDTTGDFKKDFEGQADDFVKVAQSSKVVTQATVTAVGIQKMTKDTATALVAVTTRVSNLASDKQDPRAWRLTVELQREGGQIKLAKVEFQP